MSNEVFDILEAREQIAQLRQQRDALADALKHIVFTVRDQKCSISEFEAQQVVVNTAESALAKVSK